MVTAGAVAVVVVVVNRVVETAVEVSEVTIEVEVGAVAVTLLVSGACNKTSQDVVTVADICQNN